MKKVKTAVVAIAIAVIAITSISCKDTKKSEPAAPISNEMHQEDVNAEGEVMNSANQNSATTAIISEYLSIKDALVEDNSDEAADAGDKLVTALESFNLSGYSDSEQNDLKNIIDNAKVHAGNISENPIAKQREQFKMLNKDITEMVAITGSGQKLYEQFCPMYDKGSAWLSASNKVRNPYYGSEMLTCGKVQREIN